MISIKEDIERCRPENWPRNPIATAMLFSDVYRDSVVYVPERKSFFLYDNGAWVQDSSECILTHEKIKDFVLSVITRIREVGNEQDKEDVASKYYAGYLSRKKRTELLADIKGTHTRRVIDFDSNPLLLNCENGTLNLVTGELQPHNPHDLLTKKANVTFDKDAKCPRFCKFIDEIMQGNQETIAYLQETLGYSISGLSDQECCFVWYGASTRNGKGTLNTVMSKLLGNYAQNADYSTFRKKDFGSDGAKASEDVARLAGARYVAVSEPDQDMVIDSALLKTLTGNDRITARNLYESSFEFIPRFKITINTNHLPKIPDDSVFSSGRVKVIPFSRHFEAAEQDRTLKETLLDSASLSGVLNWLLEGFKRYYLIKTLQEPEIVTQEINKYRESNDRVGEFAKDCLVSDMEGGKLKLTDVYALYTRWTKENGYNRPYGKSIFKEKLSKIYDIGTSEHQYQVFNVMKNPGIPPEWL